MGLFPEMQTAVMAAVKLLAIEDFLIPMSPNTQSKYAVTSGAFDITAYRG